MPRRHYYNCWGWIQERASQDSLTLPEQRLVATLHEFDIYLREVSDKYASYKSFAPLMDYLDDIRGSLEEGIGWIRDWVELRLSYSELSEQLHEGTAAALEACLDADVFLFRKLPANLPENISTLVDDAESIAAAQYEEIRQHGYGVHAILIGAA